MTQIKKILVACGLHGHDESVLGCARAIAEKQEAELHLLHVLPKDGNEENAKAETRHAREQLEKLLPAEQVLKLKLRWEARHGSVSKTIVGYAEEADIDMIVMGSQRQSAFARVLSTSKYIRVLRGASCPVVIVRVDREPNLATLAQMAAVLEEVFGDHVPGDRQAAQVQMRDTLEERFDLSSAQADVALQQLETANALAWEPSPGEMTTSTGSAWHIKRQAVEDAQAKPVFTPSDAQFASTPATDLLHRAFSLRATDIHIDPSQRNGYTVRMRIDGRLEHYCDLDPDLAAHLLQQFKVLADLDITDPFTPHEGRLRLNNPSLKGQVRVTTAPVQGGQSVCLRLQSQTSMFRPLGELGLLENTHDDVTKLLHRGEGLVLVTGPTGAGKTTTVYSMLRELEPHEHGRNIVTIEDPVEFNVPFLRQMSANETHGLTLDMGLRTMLRMDPDVIFVGEIRDGQTAALAMRAASSGKYVFSTLHTRDVASTVTALRDLEVTAISLAGNLTGIVSQRLVRRLCAQCRELHNVTEAERRIFADHQLDPPSMVYRAVGCDHCRHHGYFGRIGIFEVAVADSALRELIARSASEQEIREAIRAAGVPSLSNDGLTKALAGQTSIEEVQQMRWMH